LLNTYKSYMESHQAVDKNLFVYNQDPAVSALAVSLLYFPHEESDRWKSDINQSTGFQKSLFEQDYKSFLRTINPDHKDELSNYLKSQKDTTMDEVESAIGYIKLRKIKKLILQNQADMEHADPQQNPGLWLTHQHLKKMEIELTKKLGTVVIK
ncbi:MAG TPA: DNA primase, partial [Chitinophagaceae bacterium]